MLLFLYCNSLTVCDAEAERDNLEDAKNLAMQYREKDIAHVENSILLTLHNEVKCLENVEKTAAQLAKLQERIDHEAAKLDEYAIKVADITVRNRLVVICWPLLLSRHHERASKLLTGAFTICNCVEMSSLDI
jgi:hypothetical protein